MLFCQAEIGNLMFPAHRPNTRFIPACAFSAPVGSSPRVRNAVKLSGWAFIDLAGSRMCKLPFSMKFSHLFYAYIFGLVPSLQGIWQRYPKAS